MPHMSAWPALGAANARRRAKTFLKPLTVRGPLGGSYMVVALLLGLLSLAAAQQPATLEGPPQSPALRLDPNVTSVTDKERRNDFKAKSGDETEILFVDVQREFRVATPKDFDPTSTKRRSMILIYHGFSESPGKILQQFSVLLGEPDGPILVAPQGTESYGMPPSWGTRGAVLTDGPDGPLCSQSTRPFGCAANFCGNRRPCYPCLPWFSCAARCIWATCVDDFAFVNKLLDHMIASYPIDESQIFMTGFSMGGILAWDVATEPGLSQRFAAVAPLHASPQAGMIRAPPAPAQAPYLMGLWGAAGTGGSNMDMIMPPWPNIEGRSDKSVTTHNIGNTGGEFYYSSAENATTFYGRSIQCPPPGRMSVQALLAKMGGDVQRYGIKCFDDGCNGAVVRCLWATTSHMVPDFSADITWAFFKAAAAARR